MRIHGMRLLNLVFPPRPKSAAIAKERPDPAGALAAPGAD